MHFSVVTPSFRQFDWLRLCIASVRDQAGPGVSVEHIVQDAGSPGIEDFAQAAGAFLVRDGIPSGTPPSGSPDYSLVVHVEKDSGMYDAVTRGLRKTTGAVCSYLNCDEQYLPGTLARVGAWFAAHPGTDVLYGNALVTATDGTYLCDRKCLVPTRLHSLVSGNLAAFTSSTFFRRSVVERGILFDPRWKVVGDTDWNIRLIHEGVTRARCDETLSSFTHTGDNLSARPVAAEECATLRQSAPIWARWARPLILAHYRLRRLLAGAYTLQPHSYRIYTSDSPGQRREFVVHKPRFRWPEAKD